MISFLALGCLYFAGGTYSFDPNNHVNRDLLPKSCGESKDIITSNCQPWDTLLRAIRKDGKNSAVCAGILISKRYAMFPAHCVQARTEITKLAVRVGETRDEALAEGCLSPCKDIDVEEILAHPDYSHGNGIPENDIALLRLAEDVQFNDHVSPVCIPLSPKMIQDNFEDQKLAVGNWLREGGLKRRSGYDTLTVVPLEECRKKWKKFGEVTSNHICSDDTGPLCRLISGNPVLTEEEDNGTKRWYAVAIISFGSTQCGAGAPPTASIKIGPYITWILENLRK